MCAFFCVNFRLKNCSCINFFHQFHVWPEWHYLAIIFLWNQTLLSKSLYVLKSSKASWQTNPTPVFPLRKKNNNFLLFQNVPFILAPKLVFWIRDDGEEHGGGSLSTWHQDPLGAHHCIANITIFIWWTNISPSGHRLLFSNWIVVFFRERLGVLSDQKQLLDERRWPPLSLTWSNVTFFLNQWLATAQVFPKPLNLASMSTICPSLAILSSLRKTNQSSLASIFKAPQCCSCTFPSSSSFLSVYLPPLKTGTIRCCYFPCLVFIHCASISKFIHRASVSKPGAPLSPAAATQLSAAHRRTPLSIDIVPSRVSLSFVMHIQNHLLWVLALKSHSFLVSSSLRITFRGFPCLSLLCNAEVYLKKICY